MAKQNETPATDPIETPAAAKYSLNELCVNSEALFKHKPEVVIGAVFARYGDKQNEFTIAETKTAIEDFLKRKVTNDV